MPRIVYLSWPPGEISGGIKAAFQHVEMLVEGGLDAAIGSPDGSGAEWFRSKAPVIRADAIRPGDVVVLPENHEPYLSALASRANAKAVFCQNPHQVHRGLGSRLSYAEYGVTHILCPSRTVVNFCARRFPGIRLGYTPYFIDHERFVFRSEKTLQIATVARKRPVEAGAIADLLRAWHPEFAGVPWLLLHGATEAQVADAMGRSAVFLSLARLEAHAMTALEAMASGCVVAGFGGVYGGNDSATARNGFWAAEDDVYGCVEQLAHALRLVTSGGEAHRAMAEEGLRTAQEYRREESARRLLAFWKSF